MKNIRKVVFIMTDTQRKDMVGCYGHPQMKTPYIDALAEEGIRLIGLTVHNLCANLQEQLYLQDFIHILLGDGLTLWE